jgi:hypothetical protein
LDGHVRGAPDFFEAWRGEPIAVAAPWYGANRKGAYSKDGHGKSGDDATTRAMDIEGKHADSWMFVPPGGKDAEHAFLVPD